MKLLEAMAWFVIAWFAILYVLGVMRKRENRELADKDFEPKWGFCRIHRIYDPIATRVYLTRFILVMTPWLHVYLHRIWFPDPDRHVHNHPWRAFALILHGGYVNEVVTPSWDPTLLAGAPTMTNFHAHNAPCINTLRDDQYHRIVTVLPNTWTLLVGGRRVREWGFLVDGTHINRKPYFTAFEGGKRK